MWNDDGHGVRMHDAYGGGWTLMLILVVLLAIAVAVLVAVVLRPTHPAPPVTTTPPESEAQQILWRRLASGEIDEEEFRGRRAALADDEPWR